ncbi:hypothetical protein TrRE_jg4538, partial [Triparma retinervis]
MNNSNNANDETKTTSTKTSTQSTKGKTEQGRSNPKSRPIKKNNNNRSKRHPKLCFVCADPSNVVKYKCPSCLVPYCSLPCFKVHKGTPQCVAKSKPAVGKSLSGSFPQPSPEVSASMLSHALERARRAGSSSSESASNLLTRSDMDRMDGSEWLKRA